MEGYVYNSTFGYDRGYGDGGVCGCGFCCGFSVRGLSTHYSATDDSTGFEDDNIGYGDGTTHGRGTSNGDGYGRGSGASRGTAAGRGGYVW